MSSAINLADITPGFADPVFDSQAVFRSVLHALAHPGTITQLPVALYPPAPHFEAQAAIALTMLDFETSTYIDPSCGDESLGPWLRFHCGCPIVDTPADAAFAFVTATSLPPLTNFNAGDPKYPDQSTSVVIGCEALSGGDTLWLTGPGIETQIAIAPVGLPSDFDNQLRANRDLFPLGVDIILVCDNAIIGLPRTVRVMSKEPNQCMSR
jgi:alpha-D-ribose 1-methylphosphonate 5-triphosphate synthase subunit PhnH